jgi:hypothetical protein
MSSSFSLEATNAAALSAGRARGGPSPAPLGRADLFNKKLPHATSDDIA